MKSTGQANWEMHTTTRVFTGGAEFDVVEVTADLVGLSRDEVEVKEKESCVLITMGEDNADANKTLYGKRFEIPNRFENDVAVAEYNHGVLKVYARAEKGNWHAGQTAVSDLELKLDFWDGF